MSEAIRILNLTNLSAEQAAMEAQFAQFAGKRGATKIPPTEQAQGLVDELNSGLPYRYVWDTPTHIAVFDTEKAAAQLASSLTRQMAQLAFVEVNGKQKGKYRAVAQSVGTGWAVRAYPVTFRGSNS